ncbi:hypothetical protein GQX74_002976 [Glossina fuscipes]|nr:hypothetical protein GQX74_002976 [Glossina fuscipes]
MLKNMQCLRTRALNVLRSAVSTATKGNLENIDETKLTPNGASKANQNVKYTDEEKEKILKIINNGNIDDLLSYDISKVRANKLISWLKQNGALKDLNDILNIEGFGAKSVIKFYQSLLNEKDAEMRKSKYSLKLSKSFITPKMDIIQRLNIKSCVAVRIGINHLAWARLELPPVRTETPTVLTHWQQHDVVEKKLHLSELVQRCLYANHLIPTGDCYILENPPSVQASNKPSNVEQKNVNIQKAQIIAMMGLALAFLSARLFNYLVGTERVSSEKTVINMMRTYYNVDELHRDSKDFLTIRNNVQFPADLREMFSSASPSNRDLLSQALLLNLTFVRLILFEDKESIATVTGLNRKA